MLPHLSANRQQEPLDECIARENGPCYRSIISVDYLTDSIERLLLAVDIPTICYLLP